MAKLQITYLCYFTSFMLALYMRMGVAALMTMRELDAWRDKHAKVTT